MNNIFETISKIGIVPVIALDDAKKALPLADALAKGGLPCAEVTFRTDAAEEAIKIIADNRPDMLIGAGTVLSVEQVKRAVSAGASFIVSPGINEKVVTYCLEHNIPVLPGCATPSDVELALSLGLTHVKFFPAEAAGGIKMIKAMSAPYGSVKFMPTGGINADNLLSYLSFGMVFACGGSWMVDKKLIAEDRFDEITCLTKNAVKTMLGFELRHIGINCEDGQSALNLANLISKAFSFDIRETEKSYFTGTGFEVMKYEGPGKKGHIALSVNSCDRAVFQLERAGFEFDYSTVQKNAAGSITFIYLKGDFGGFNIHFSAK